MHALVLFIADFAILDRQETNFKIGIDMVCIYSV